MKRVVPVLIPVILIVSVVHSQPGSGTVQVDNNIHNTQAQNATAIGGGNADSTSTAVVGDNTAILEGGNSNSISYSNSVSEGGTGIGWSNSVSEGGTGIGWSNSTSEGGVGWSDSASVSSVNISTTSISNIKNRTAPLTTYPPYLPLWNHGGWGTINAYFPNGPTTNDAVYQRTFDPSDPLDVRELKGILKALPHDGALKTLGGVVNGVRVLLGGPDYFHRGRGFEIANAIVRKRRPKGKPLAVFIDSYVDPQLLKEEGYSYVGKLSLEGDPEVNWDHIYNAAVAEALPWDVDVMLIAGGMKGVTVGSNTSFPSATYGYAQTNYSLSLLGGRSQGITEGKGEAVLSASAWRFDPRMIQRKQVDERLFEKIRRRPVAAAAVQGPPQATAATATAAPVVVPATRPATEPEEVPQDGSAPGIEVTKKLYDMAGFGGKVDNVTVK